MKTNQNLTEETIELLEWSEPGHYEWFIRAGSRDIIVALEMVSVLKERFCPTFGSVKC